METKQTNKTQSRPQFHGKSLEEVHGTVNTQHPKLWKRIFAFAGPAYLVSVGYMDPGNWATDLAEVLGTIIGLNLLFGLPLLWGQTVDPVRHRVGIPVLVVR